MKKKPIGKTVTKIATLSAGIDGINQAVRALYAYKQHATYKDLAKGANLHPVYMSQSLSAARDVGLAESAGKRGLYKLTSDGEEYARLLSYGQESQCRELLRNNILNNPLWSEIIRFLRMSKGQARDPLLLVADVEGKLGKRWAPSVRSSYASTYNSVLEFAGLVRMEGGNVVSLIEEDGGLEEKPEKRTEAFPSEARPKPLPATPEGYVDFSISDSFRVIVRRKRDSLEFFENQIKEDSIFAHWIKHEKEKLKKED